MSSFCLDPSFYEREDVVQIAQELLGKILFSRMKGEVTAGVIVETEAYRGIHDRACHAYNGRRTRRTEVMYQPGGVAYIYLCYGIHELLNVVTGPAEVPHAVLIRALFPTHGVEKMQQRRGGKKPLCGGPGTLTQALGITRALNGLSLSPLSCDTALWIEDHGIIPPSIVTTPRIGVDYAGVDALLPYRFVAPRFVAPLVLADPLL